VGGDFNKKVVQRVITEKLKMNSYINRADSPYPQYVF